MDQQVIQQIESEINKKKQELKDKVKQIAQDTKKKLDIAAEIREMEKGLAYLTGNYVVKKYPKKEDKKPAQ